MQYMQLVVCGLFLTVKFSCLFAVVAGLVCLRSLINGLGRRNLRIRQSRQDVLYELDFTLRTARQGQCVRLTPMTLNSGSTVYFIFWSFDNDLSSITRSQVSSNRNLKSLATCAANNACKDREIAKLDCWLIILYFLLVCLFVLCFLNLFIFVLHKVN